MDETMKKFDRDALRLEKFLHTRRPLKASPAPEALSGSEVKEFDGVLYLPKERMVYCSYYDSAEEVAVLVPVVGLVFEDT